ASVRAQLAQVDEADNRAVSVDRRAADQGQPAEERTEVLDHELELAVQPIHRPGDLAVAVSRDNGRTTVTFAGKTECSAEIEQRNRRAVTHDHRLARQRVHRDILERDRLDNSWHRK